MRTWVISVVLIVLGAVAHAQENAQRADEDLRAHLATLRNTLNDPNVVLAQRERVAQEAAGTLDRAAQAAPSSTARRAYWSEAAQVLDEFTTHNGSHSQIQAFRFQSSVYLWAAARTWLTASQQNPTDSRARAEALKDLKSCSERFKAVLAALPAGATDVFAQNVRYRTAQALADLAEVLTDEAERAAMNREARRVIDPPTSEESLAGFAHLLRGTLDARLGAFEQARKELDAAAASKPPPPAADLLDARLVLRLGSRAYDEALQAVEAAAIDPASRSALKVRVLLAERSGTAEINRRLAAETALFGELARLRDSGRGDARAALMSAAQAIAEPSPGQDASAWDLLAAGAILLGNPTRAGDLERKGASRAESQKQPKLATDLRLRAGAYYFQAENFEAAEPLLTRVFENPEAGPARPRAGMLLALARGRALALKRPGASQSSYAAALKQQIKAFPDDPSTAEARWLLGKLLAAEGDPAGAIALWDVIPYGQARWLESRLEIVAMTQKTIDAERASRDRAALENAMSDARAFLKKSLESARDEIQQNELRLASAQLELTPKLGRTPEAIAALERVQKSAATPLQREAARRLNILALAMANRWVEVEQLARQEAQDSSPAALIGLIRLIDRAAAEADSDLKTRRFGLVARLLLARASEHPDAQNAALRAEIHLRLIRAMLFSGDEAGARRALTHGSERLPSHGDDELRDLAELYLKLGAFDLALDVHRLRARSLAPGSLPWFEVRYAIALAAYRAGKAKEALRIIDGTAVLHPELGGGELREKFLHLRQRIGPGSL